ncbi:MAG: hypothetical protein GY841_15580 [FCB group bacterium]|nr:hypothetical protein [FCB group bacterium]
MSEQKKLINFDEFKRLMFGPADECNDCLHMDGCYCQDEPHPNCPIWASLECEPSKELSIQSTARRHAPGRGSHLADIFKKCPSVEDVRLTEMYNENRHPIYKVEIKPANNKTFNETVNHIIAGLGQHVIRDCFWAKWGSANE